MDPNLPIRPAAPQKNENPAPEGSDMLSQVKKRAKNAMADTATLYGSSSSGPTPTPTPEPTPTPTPTPPPPPSFGLTVDPQTLCCGVGQPIVAVASVTGGGSKTVNITGPGGTSATGTDSATLTYYTTEGDCGTTLQFTASADGFENQVQNVNVIGIVFVGLQIGSAETQVDVDPDTGNMDVFVDVLYNATLGVRPVGLHLGAVPYIFRVQQFIFGEYKVFFNDGTHKTGGKYGIEDVPLTGLTLDNDAIEVIGGDEPGPTIQAADIPDVAQVTCQATANLYIEYKCLGAEDWDTLAKVTWTWTGGWVFTNGPWGGVGEAYGDASDEYPPEPPDHP